MALWSCNRHNAFCIELFKSWGGSCSFPQRRDDVVGIFQEMVQEFSQGWSFSGAGLLDVRLTKTAFQAPASDFPMDASFAALTSVNQGALFLR